MNSNEKLRRLANAKKIPTDINERTLIELMPTTWPKRFYTTANGRSGITCADINKEPCKDCDGEKCVRAYIELSM